ncbi:hypothetical protein [Streptomyces sp. NPDC058371]|uniref:hypothetical protein n=1 Tax=Streptomyces sp. NPDC058371 TaxID=3346463 RepID=UPI003653FAC9
MFNACAPRLRDDPYPFYKRLRDVEPVHRTTYGHWGGSGYSAVASLIRCSELTSEYPQDPVRLDRTGSLAALVPVTVVCGLGALPVEDRDLRRKRTDALGHVIDPATDETAPRAMADPAEEFGAYVAEHLAGRRADPRDDVNSRPGIPTPSGSKVMLLLGAAHRDPRRHPATDRLDLAREDLVRRPQVTVRGSRELRVDLVS